MKSCILSLIWPKKDVHAFFARHGCDKKDLAAIDNFSGMTRSAMVDAVFANLEARPDEGLGPFRAMLQSLLDWKHFDTYWFDREKKLDRAVAQRNLEHLKQLQEIRDARIKEERKRREGADTAAQTTRKTLGGVRKEFLELHAGNIKPTARGYALERVLAELAKLSKLEVTDPFRVNGEQIDGALKYDGEHYIIEAKWQEAAAANEGVYQFVAKAEGKMYGRGLFVSVKGFTKNVVTSIVQGKALKTIFIDGEDLMLVLEEHLTFAKMIDSKVKAAQTKGLIYVHPLTAAAKSGI